MSFLLCLFIFVGGAGAEDYRIEQARGQGISERKTATGIRQFLKWQNHQGTHVFIVDEETSQPALKDFASLRAAMAMSESGCTIEVSCAAKAFCTGSCRNMYYEFTNAPAAATAGQAADARNRCVLSGFDCTKQSQKPAGNP
jgi:hypothetical protein